jgi:hypothetical protein
VWYAEQISGGRDRASCRNVGYAACSGEKETDRRADVQKLIEQGQYGPAKQMLIALRSNYPNDQQLVEMELFATPRSPSEVCRHLKEAEARTTIRSGSKR